jgi:hypothetical protein
MKTTSSKLTMLQKSLAAGKHYQNKIPKKTFQPTLTQCAVL